MPVAMSNGRSSVIGSIIFIASGPSCGACRPTVCGRFGHEDTERWWINWIGFIESLNLLVD